MNVLLKEEVILFKCKKCEYQCLCNLVLVIAAS